MLDGLCTLGVGVEQVDKHIFSVQAVAGISGQGCRVVSGKCGNSVSPADSGVALSGGRYKLSGVARMHERPIGDLVDALRLLGANINYLGSEGFPRLRFFRRR